MMTTLGAGITDNRGEDALRGALSASGLDGGGGFQRPGRSGLDRRVSWRAAPFCNMLDYGGFTRGRGTSCRDPKKTVFFFFFLKAGIPDLHTSIHCGAHAAPFLTRGDVISRISLYGWIPERAGTNHPDHWSISWGDRGFFFLVLHYQAWTRRGGGRELSSFSLHELPAICLPFERVLFALNTTSVIRG